MSNPNAPFGFRPVRRLDGAMPNYQTNRYLISLSNTNRIATGDVVKYDGTNAGYIDKAATTDTPVLGIFAGCEWFDSSQQKKIFSPQWTGTTSVVAGSLIQAYVYDDVQIVFEVQSGSGTVVPQSAARQNAKYSGSAGGVSPFVTGISVETLDDANIATNQATYPFKIVELSQKVGNDNTSGYNIVEVVLNATNYKSGVA
jgi:hypothetical protein